MEFEQNEEEPEMGFVIRNGELIHKSKMCLDYPVKKFEIDIENISAEAECIIDK